MAYPQTFDVFAGTGAQGTNLLTTPDHALDHRTLGSAVGTLEHVIGTTNGTQALMNFQAGDFAARINSGGTLQQLVIGTVNLTAGTITGQIQNNGTVANGAYGTATYQGGTANSLTLGTQVARGEFSNGNISGQGTINWANGDRQQGTLTAAGTISWSNAQAGQILVFRLLQNGTGGFAVTLPAGKWSNGITGSFGTAASAINLLVTYYDGANYLYQLAPGFA